MRGLPWAVQGPRRLPGGGRVSDALALDGIQAGFRFIPQAWSQHL